MNLNLKILQESDVTQSYVNWFSNKEITRYSDNQYREFTFKGQCAYVIDCLNSSDVDLYGIFDENFHIGNIAINGLNSIHRRAELTYVVGEESYWGKGVGYYAVASLIKIAQENYQLNKLCAGLAEGNIGSRRVLEKNNFLLEGKRLNHLFYDGEFHHQLDYGLKIN